MPKLSEAKKEQIENAIFLNRKPGDKFTAAGIIAVTGAAKTHVRNVIAELIMEKKIKAEGKGRDTVYNIMEK